ncbi:MAG TPA: hypothetical protein VN915_06630 [Elusimicrobiota bacterium]|nr:hypothetical protein [Elusimicrobiota bacterium]
MPIALRAREPETPDINTPERFQEFARTLEICRDHALSDDPVRIRLALIVLDNLAEILMFHRCQARFDSEDYVKHILRPKLPEDLRKGAERDFAGKIRFLTLVDNSISARDAAILRISHSYRNVAFHRGEHNPRANSAITRILLDTVCRMFRTTYEHGGMCGGNPEHVAWLKGYGYSKPYLEYSEAAQRISVALVAGTEFSFPVLRETLIGDLNTRHAEMIHSTLRDLPVPELILDTILKSEEFDSEYDYDSVSTPLREAGYGFAEGTPPARDEYIRLEHDYTVRVRADYDGFKPSFTWHRVCALGKSIERLSKTATPSVLVPRYHQLNEFLAQAEKFLYAAIRKNEAAIQFASELARGK